MKAISLKGFGGVENLFLDDIEKPVPGPDQILIKVHASSVNRPDIVQREGNYPPPKGDSEVLGLEVAGTVEALGDGASDGPSRHRVGDRVFALVGGGGYAEYAVAYEGHVMPIPENLSFAQAACICETYITAYLNAVVLAEAKAEDTFLLHGGGGGVNTASIQVCKALFPESTVIVTASSGKVERVKALGVDHVIDYKTQSFADEIKTLTGGRGVDVILDHIGAAYLKDNMKCLALSGRLVIIGLMGGIKAELNLATMMVKRQKIIGSVLRSRPVPEKSAIIADFESTVMPFFANGTIAPLISDVFPLSQAADAHRAMEQGTHFGKIVLEFQ